MVLRHSTLSARGRELMSKSIREKLGAIFKDIYDPDTNPNGIINMGTAENYVMLDDIAEFLSSHVRISKSQLSYGEGPWGTERLRKAMANHLNRQFKALHPVDPANIIFASGVTSICEMLGFAIGDAGDGILLSSPVYQAFQFDFDTDAKVKPVFAKLSGVDQFGPECVKRYEEALLDAEKKGIRVRGMVLCHPHNPLGQSYPRETVIAIMKFCDKYKIHLIVDEIYALSTYPIDDPDYVKFESILSWDSSQYIDQEYLHQMYGMSKDFASGGLRLGCICTQNKELLTAVGAISNFHWSGSPSDVAAITMLEDQTWVDEVLAKARSRLSSNSKLARELLEDMKIPYNKHANAGFFLWADFRAFLPAPEAGVRKEDNWKGEQALAAKMLENKVFLTDGRSQSAEEAGFFRIVFTHEPSTLREGFKRMARALEQVKQTSD